MKVTRISLLLVLVSLLLVSLVLVAILFFAGLFAHRNECTDETSTKWKAFIEEGRDRMVINVTVPGDGAKNNCYLFGEKKTIRKTLDSVPYCERIYVDSATMEGVIKDCEDAMRSKNYTWKLPWDVFSLHTFFNFFTISPGTKYCGPGNISTGWDDLGSDVVADSCCRKHDSCPDNIGPNETKHGLYNDLPYTTSNCMCDWDLYQCLQNENSLVSNFVGEVNFNRFQARCFTKYYPIIGCKKFRGASGEGCQDYVFDFTAEPVWQFFDAKIYEAKADSRVGKKLGIYGQIVKLFMKVLEYLEDFRIILLTCNDRLIMVARYFIHVLLQTLSHKYIAMQTYVFFK